MRILVCGGRDFTDKDLLWKILDEINAENQIVEIIHGDARGADSLAGEYARSNRIIETPFPADWEQYGKAAGMIRNKEMIKLNPDLVVSFPGGKGTQNMESIAIRENVKLIRARRKDAEIREIDVDLLFE